MFFEIQEIFKFELRAFLKSGVSSLLLLVITSLIWGGVIAGKVETIQFADSWLWVIFFALVAGAAFSTTVFVRERLSSTMEILLISGVERASILWGKLIFTTTFTIFTGLLAFAMAWICRSLILQLPFFLPRELLQTLTLFIASSFCVSSSSAMLSLSLANPRLVQFLNFLILTVLSTIFALISSFFDVSLYLFALIEIIFGILFSIISQFQFSRETIIQPLVY